MFRLPKGMFVCRKCGSRNVELRRTPRAGNFWEKLADIFADPIMRRGTQFLVCKDCGHASAIMVD